MLVQTRLVDWCQLYWTVTRNFQLSSFYRPYLFDLVELADKPLSASPPPPANLISTFQRTTLTSKVRNKIIVINQKCQRFLQVKFQNNSSIKIARCSREGLLTNWNFNGFKDLLAMEFDKESELSAVKMDISWQKADMQFSHYFHKKI